MYFDFVYSLFRIILESDCKYVLKCCTLSILNKKGEIYLFD